MLTMQVPSELTLPSKMCLIKNRNPQLFVLITHMHLFYSGENKNFPRESKHKIDALEYKDQWPLKTVCAHMIIDTFLYVDFTLK